MSRHIAFERLADLAEGLTSGHQDEARNHISTCRRCEAEFARLASIIGVMRADMTEEPPADVVAHVGRLFRSYIVSRESSAVRRLVAALKFDSWHMTPAYGVRSGQRANARQVLFIAHEYDLDLRIASGDEGWVILGQAFGPECQGGRIELEGVSGITSVELNNQCEFSLPPVPTGSYTFRLCLPGTVVEIPELELKADGA